MSETPKPLTETQKNESEKQETPLERIFCLPNIPSVKQEFIADRTKELGENETRQIDTDQYIYAPIVDGFFDEKMKIQPGSGDTFSIDDKEIYEKIVNKILLYGKDREIVAVQHATSEYFGNFVPSAEDRAIRASKFEGVPKGTNYSIADNKKGAMCTERAAVAHNLLQFIGVESHFVLGYLEEEKTNGNKNKERHSFLLIKPSDTYLIFDPSNPTYCYGDEELTEFQQYLPYTIDTGMSELPKIHSTFSAEAVDRFKNKAGTKDQRKKCDRTYIIGH